ncbi:hypothetical protein BJY52DRAFT_1313190 [Lactarius psammicola]|nr:hypothetical protein BJY52DRAFT_1313190 [Lactarius psammicola]
MVSTSTIISVIMSVIAVVGVTSVYVSRRLKKNPMRSKSSARASLLAATSLAAKRKTPIPAKIAFAGENTCKI